MKSLTSPTKAEIRRELAALAHGKKRTWAQISALLHAIEDIGYWRDEAPSFTKWVRMNTKIFGVKEPSLWRFLGAGRTYRRLCRDLHIQPNRCLPLYNLPPQVSPDNLELLSKLSRIIPSPDLKELFEGVLMGELPRAILRTRWRDVRDVFEKKTARGRNVSPPRLDPEDFGARAALFEASTLDALRASPPNWTGVSTIESFAIFSRVLTPEIVTGTRRFFRSFDAVAVVQPVNEMPQFHGVDIQILLGPNADQFAVLNNSIPYFDYFWIAVPASTDHNLFGHLRRDVGILLIEKEAIVAFRRAEKLAQQTDRAEKRLALAAALVLRAAK